MAEYIFRLGRWLSAQQQGQGVEVSLLTCIKVKVTGGSGKGAALFGKSENQKRFFMLFRCNDRVCDETTCLLYFFSFCRKAKKRQNSCTHPKSCAQIDVAECRYTPEKHRAGRRPFLIRSGFFVLASGAVECEELGPFCSLSSLLPNMLAYCARLNRSLLNWIAGSDRSRRVQGQVGDFFFAWTSFKQ